MIGGHDAIQIMLAATVLVSTLIHIFIFLNIGSEKYDEKRNINKDIKKSTRPPSHFLRFEEKSSVRAPKTSILKPQKSPQKKFESQKSNRENQQLQRFLRHNPFGIETSEHLDVYAKSNDDGSIGGDLYFKDSLELPRPLERVWRQIRTQVYYHPDFFIEKLQGDVNAEILIGLKGKLEALVSISGQPELVEWVKTGLSRALHQDFLKQALRKKILLELCFRFRILIAPPMIPEFVFSQQKLNFDILGYQPPVDSSKNTIKNLISTPKMYRRSQWNLSHQLKPYTTACFQQKNAVGCETLIQMYTQAGLIEEAQKVKIFLQSISASN